MTVYKIETRSDATRSWSGIVVIKPDYRFATDWVRPWFWFARRVIVAVNPDEAEEAALARAIAIARPQARHGQCRVVRESEIDGSKAVDVVWQDGRRTEAGWLQRVINWWYG